MKIFPDKFPGNIPYLLAGFLGGFGTIFGLTALIAEEQIGRPSSTHAIGFIFVPICAVLLALACFCVGLVVRSIVGKFVSSRAISKRNNQLINILFVCTLVLAFFSGVAFIQRQEVKQQPHLIFDSGKIIKISPSEIRGKKEKDATFVLSIYNDDKNMVAPFLWNGKKIDFKVVGNNTLKILDIGGNELVAADLHKFDYIGRVHVLQIALGNSESKSLVVLVRLRATSRRSMLLIYDATAKLLYQELLNRTDDNEMNLLVDDDGKEYLYVDVDTPIVYSNALK